MYHGTAVFVNCGKGQPPKAMGFWRRVVRPTGFEPAAYGEYLALRILIGEAAGRNWWCVVFPPLCTAAASDVPAVALDAGLTDQEVALITETDEGYILKFKSVELWQALKAKLTR